MYLENFKISLIQRISSIRYNVLVFYQKCKILIKKMPKIAIRIIKYLKLQNLNLKISKN